MATSTGTIEVKAPRVNDKRIDPDTESASGSPQRSCCHGRASRQGSLRCCRWRLRAERSGVVSRRMASMSSAASASFGSTLARAASRMRALTGDFVRGRNLEALVRTRSVRIRRRPGRRRVQLRRQPMRCRSTCGKLRGRGPRYTCAAGNGDITAHAVWMALALYRRADANPVHHVGKIRVPAHASRLCARTSSCARVFARLDTDRPGAPDGCTSAHVRILKSHADSATPRAWR